MARSGADGVLIAGVVEEAAPVLKAVRARVDDGVEIMMTDAAVPVPFLLELAGPAARGVYMSFPDVPPAAGRLTAAGQRFADEFGLLDAPTAYALPAAQAAEVVLDAIARSDGTRGSVLSELQDTEVQGGILGSFRFDQNGDIVPARIPILRVTGEARVGHWPLRVHGGGCRRPRSDGAREAVRLVSAAAAPRRRAAWPRASRRGRSSPA